MADEQNGGNLPKQVIIENSYILDSESYGEAYVIRQEKIQKIILEALEQRLAGQVYDPVKGAQRAKQLADEIKELVKTLGNSRHKIIVQVLLGQKKGQALRVVSRCLWDVHSDTAASATYENETMYCVCQVYGLYLE